MKSGVISGIGPGGAAPSLLEYSPLSRSKEGLSACRSPGLFRWCPMN